MNVALDVDEAAAGEIALTQQGNRTSVLNPLRILGAVDESGQVASVHVAEAVNLLDHRHGVPQREAQPTREGEDQIAPVAAQMHEDVGFGGRRRTPGVGEGLKWRKSSRPSRGIETVPHRSAKGDDAHQLGSWVERRHLRGHPRQPRRRLANPLLCLLARAELESQKGRMAIAVGKDSALWLPHVLVHSLNGSHRGLSCPATREIFAMRTSMARHLLHIVQRRRRRSMIECNRHFWTTSQNR